VNLPAPLDLLPHLLPGLGLTVALTVGGIVLATAAAVTAGLARLSPRLAVRAAATAYVETFRGTSALVQLFWFYFALPFVGVDLPAFWAGVLVLGLNTGAYGAEVVRGAMRSVPGGQVEAARALGFSRRQIRWRVVFPQAAVAMLPPAGNLAVELLKATALVSMITLAELTFRAQVLRSSTLRTVEIFAVVLVLYYGLARLLGIGFGALERRLGAGRLEEAA